MLTVGCWVGRSTHVPPLRSLRRLPPRPLLGLFPPHEVERIERGEGGEGIDRGGDDGNGLKGVNGQCEEERALRHLEYT